jgi:glycosyltransferase involved in cell wall biosynthesis
MTISLIICTRNRAEPLRRCLAAVAAIVHDGDWELVIVDNGSTDATPAVIGGFAEAQDFRVVLVSQPLPGLSNARNAGVAAARGSLVLFTDDDCYVAPDLLDATRAAFADPAIGFVTGRVRLFDPGDARITINESTVSVGFAARAFLATGLVKGANLGFRRAALDRIALGGQPFDPLLGAGARFPAGEDSDAAQRVALAGWAGAYDPAMVVFHHHGRRSADVAALYRGYDVGRGAFHAKLLTLAGGFRAGLRAWAGLPARVRARPALLGGELRGALGYWRAQLNR